MSAQLDVQESTAPRRTRFDARRASFRGTRSWLHSSSGGDSSCPCPHAESACSERLRAGRHFSADSSTQIAAASPEPGSSLFSSLRPSRHASTTRDRLPTTSADSSSSDTHRRRPDVHATQAARRGLRAQHPATRRLRVGRHFSADSSAQIAVASPEPGSSLFSCLRPSRHASTSATVCRLLRPIQVHPTPIVADTHRRRPDVQCDSSRAARPPRVTSRDATYFRARLAAGCAVPSEAAAFGETGERLAAGFGRGARQQAVADRARARRVGKGARGNQPQTQRFVEHALVGDGA
jgi:hypothetical protein